jgi:hypothetical protein
MTSKMEMSPSNSLKRRNSVALENVIANSMHIAALAFWSAPVPPALFHFSCYMFGANFRGWTQKIERLIFGVEHNA